MILWIHKNEWRKSLFQNQMKKMKKKNCLWKLNKRKTNQNKMIFPCNAFVIFKILDVVLPKLQYCRVIRRLCDTGVICGRLIDNSSPYDAVERHFCNFFPPCDRDFRIESGIVYCELAPPRRIGLPVPLTPQLMPVRSWIDTDVAGPPHNPFIWELFVYNLWTLTKIFVFHFFQFFFVFFFYWRIIEWEKKKWKTNKFLLLLSERFVNKFQLVVVLINIFVIWYRKTEEKKLKSWNKLPNWDSYIERKKGS